MHSESDNLWPSVLGQDVAKKQIREFLRSDRLAHAYLFYGEQGVGKDALALHVACALHCEEKTLIGCGTCPECTKILKLQHPDVRFVFALPAGQNEGKADDPLERLSPDTLKSVRDQLRIKAENPYHPLSVAGATAIRINTVRALRREAALSTTGGKKRVIIVSRADQMNEESSNALLKLLEEPNKLTMFILTTAFPDRLLPTIRSRCHPVRFDLIPSHLIRKELIGRGLAAPQEAELISLLAMGSYDRALNLLAENIVDERQKTVEFIRVLLGTNFNRLMSAVEDLAGPKNRDLVLRTLNLVIIWFRDALMLKEGKSILNVDQEEDLHRFLLKFPEVDFSTVLREVETAVSLVERNGYIPLVLMRMSLELRSIILSPGSLIRS